jgi:hypothetical protein
VTPSQWKAIGILSGVFLLGTVSGVGGTLVYVARERASLHHFDLGHRRNMPLMALNRRLGLSEPQREQIATILERRAPERRKVMQQVLDSCGSSVRDEKAKLDAEIRGVLTPDQQKKFDDLAARQKERLFAPFGGELGPEHAEPAHSGQTPAAP